MESQKLKERVSIRQILDLLKEEYGDPERRPEYDPI